LDRIKYYINQVKQNIFFVEDLHETLFFSVLITYYFLSVSYLQKIWVKFFYIYLNFTKLVNEKYIINDRLEPIYKINRDKIKLKTDTKNTKKNRLNAKMMF